MNAVNISISKPRKKVGRPRKPDAATTVVPVQLSKATVKELDRWAKESGIGSRSGGARALIEAGLAAAPKRRKEK
jgi:metal-responsive CopG/Arc/MetJ family transcriptional regulator